MLLSAILLAWPLQQAVAPELYSFQQDAMARLLAGDALAPDYRQQLQGMPPSERVEAIIFLRRAGLLTGKSWRVDDLLRPARNDMESDE
ncbi:hypothetical protein FNJ84_16150 [Paracoccus sp. M683]|uniref:hypothetical protein n=1 Tax=Paracoccus sp. M683 TaxID=2594268 RepID=UPI00117E1AD4|nr:hypothetical protein [Paracoccus sp. M683]TRW95510.1 hypothetical protein FNJ84_16150 [Paracoccus sp. M683]